MSLDIESGELLKWIDEHQITRQKKNLHRDFSDAVPLAEILKKHYPKIVELHNYSPKNSIIQKVHNWEIMNRKILNKLKINLTQNEIEDLAKATPGAIEKLLHKIKCKVKAKNSGCSDNNGACEENFFLEGISTDEGNSEYVAVSEQNIPSSVPAAEVTKVESAKSLETTKKLEPRKVVESAKTIEKSPAPTPTLSKRTEQTISLQEYERIKLEVLDKDDAISDLKNELDQLRSLMLAKDNRIKDLTQQLHKLVNSPSEHRGTPRASFFDKLF